MDVAGGADQFWAAFEEVIEEEEMVGERAIGRGGWGELLHVGLLLFAGSVSEGRRSSLLCLYEWLMGCPSF